jgi:hypothetical protein
VRSDRFESWLRKVQHTQDEEISCTECFDLVATYVDLELSGQAPEDEMPQVRQHLGHCAACREEYEALHDLLRLGDEGGAPPPT